MHKPICNELILENKKTQVDDMSQFDCTKKKQTRKRSQKMYAAGKYGH